MFNMSKSSRASKSVDRLDKLKTINGESLEGPGNIQITSEGVPLGGTTGQALVKASNADLDTEWASIGGGGGVDQHNDLSGRSEPNAHPASAISGLGTAATANVTTSATDTTADRLLKINDFGFPITIAGNDLFNSDFNTLVPHAVNVTTTGTWQNGPLGNVTHTGVLYQSPRRQFNNVMVQTWIRQASAGSVHQKFERQIQSNLDPEDWPDWVEIYHTGNLEITQSPTDTNSGRLLQVGNYGLGATSLVDGYNANTTRNGLMYTASTNVVNGPDFPGNQHYSILSMGALGSSNQFQFAARLAADNQLAARSSPSAPWVRLWHTGNTGNSVEFDVTEDPYDSSVNRLLRTRDFGIGTNAYRGYPVNDFNSPDNADVPVGIYSFNTSFTNRPTSAVGIMIVASRASGEKINILVTGGTSTPDMYFRRVSGSNIGPWQKNYHSNNILSAVSQSGGLPTGGIIESGENSDGQYTKYADGTLICRRKIDNIIIDIPEGAIYRSVEMNHDFPHEFSSTPSCSASVGETAMRWTSVRGRAGLTQQWQHHQWGASSSTTPRETFLLAVGRWYENN